MTEFNRFLFLAQNFIHQIMRRLYSRKTYKVLKTLPLFYLPDKDLIGFSNGKTAQPPG